MKLKEYFEKTEGVGVLATADNEGLVDAAVYARPHVLDQDTVAFIMADRLSHRNIQSNPRAAYLFVEKGPGLQGKEELYLTRTHEETDPAAVDAVRRKSRCTKPESSSAGYLVTFRIEKVRPLVGD